MPVFLQATCPFWCPVQQCVMVLFKAVYKVGTKRQKSHESYKWRIYTNLKTIISSIIPIVSIQRLHANIVFERFVNWKNTTSHSSKHLTYLSNQYPPHNELQSYGVKYNKYNRLTLTFLWDAHFFLQHVTWNALNTNLHLGILRQ